MFSQEVIAVRHEDGDNSKIIRYRLKKLQGVWDTGEISEIDRMDMLIRLGMGIKYGVRESESDESLIEVIVVRVNNNTYIKTQANDTPEDNLGNLPEF